MPDPLTILTTASTIAGTLGSLFGSGQETNLPPELSQLYKILQKRAKTGLGPDTIENLRSGLTNRIGSEFGALNALAEQKLTQAGAGVGVQNAARSDLNEDRLNAVGQGFLNIDLANEQAKSGALGQLGQLSGQLGQFTTNTGQGFADLASSGVNLLLERQNQNKTMALIEKYLNRGGPSYGDTYTAFNQAGNALNALGGLRY